MEWNREGVFGSGAGKRTDRKGELEQGLEHLVKTFAFQHHKLFSSMKFPGRWQKGLMTGPTYPSVCL